MQTEHAEPHELQQQHLTDEDLGDEEEGEEDGEEHGDNGRATQQLGGVEPEEQPTPPSMITLKEHKITDPTELKERSLKDDLNDLLNDTINDTCNSASSFADLFTKDLAPLRGLARSTFEAVEKLGKVKPTLGQKVALAHSRNYQRFTTKTKEAVDRNRKKRDLEKGYQAPEQEGGEKKESTGFHPLIAMGSIFWGDYGRFKRHQRRIKKGKAQEGTTSSELKPGEATMVQYRNGLEQRIRPLVQPLLRALRSIYAEQGLTLAGDYEGRLVRSLTPHIAHKSTTEMLKWMA